MDNMEKYLVNELTKMDDMDDIKKRLEQLEKWQADKSNTWLMGDSFIRRCFSIFFHQWVSWIIVGIIYTLFILVVVGLGNV